MIATKQSAIEKFMQMVEKRNPAQPEFHQAVYEVATGRHSIYRRTSRIQKSQYPGTHDRG